MTPSLHRSARSSVCQSVWSVRSSSSPSLRPWPLPLVLRPLCLLTSLFSLASTMSASLLSSPPSLSSPPLSSFLLFSLSLSLSLSLSPHSLVFLCVSSLGSFLVDLSFLRLSLPSFARPLRVRLLVSASPSRRLSIQVIAAALVSAAGSHQPAAPCLISSGLSSSLLFLPGPLPFFRTAAAVFVSHQSTLSWIALAFARPERNCCYFQPGSSHVNLTLLLRRLFIHAHKKYLVGCTRLWLEWPCAMQS